ncbi:hypothetical protein Thivi_3436 [Thiocystis violascens DSM 198]|uniref:Uncharacterized protein n=1 Tax=Thiocystis violascens (strain ATCC 17096 / DSM 198 / 6111) TaxID=765911 RepID=I3YE88_THIV6|nr:hypothetical protein Thivi_3436 [Thiocystis violascens DSM 198]
MFKVPLAMMPGVPGIMANGGPSLDRWDAPPDYAVAVFLRRSAVSSAVFFSSQAR